MDINNPADIEKSGKGQAQNLSAKKPLWWLSRLIAPVAFFLSGIFLIVGVGVAQRAGWILVSEESDKNKSSKDAIYTCPMHPQIRQSTPEPRCPICDMPLVPATSSSTIDLESLSVNIEPAHRRLANIQTTEAKREILYETIESIGSITIDESRQVTIASYTSGRLERLFADYTGVEVTKGDHLAVIYSPDLYTAQIEYIESRNSLKKMTSDALKSVKDIQVRLVNNSRQKLIELGMTKKQITDLDKKGEAKSRLIVYTPVSGTVTEKLAIEGNYIKAGEPIYRIVNLSTVWLMLEMYPEDASRIRFGQKVTAQIDSLPGKTFSGRVAFIDPTVDTKKRTVGVRVEFFNKDRKLRPGDYASATVHVPINQEGIVFDSDLAGQWISPMHPQIIRDAPGKCPICGMDLVKTSRYGYSDKPVKQTASLYVPRKAVLMAGNHSVVYVEIEPGKFQIRSVTMGSILRDKVIIIKGIKEGEKVAVSGNFLIDSQMQLAGNPSLIDPTKAIAAQKIRNTPLEFKKVNVKSVSGESGKQIEQFYENYFLIQKAFAGDKKPSEKSVINFNKYATSLSKLESISVDSRSLFKTISKLSGHLHHMSINNSRAHFKEISHAVIELATKIRGSQAEKQFTHFFCPMVKGGGGDWLQSDAKLVNPYYGKQMLRCGNNVRLYPLNSGTLKSEEKKKSKRNRPATKTPDQEKK